MDMLNCESTLEYKLKCLKWTLENEGIKTIGEYVQHSGEILNDLQVRAALPSLLRDAYHKQRIQVVMLLLDILAEDVMRAPSPWFHEIFCSAVKAGQSSLVTKMIELGADVNANSVGKPLLHSAACHGHTVVVTELLNEGADINAVDNKGEAILHNVLKSQLNSKLSVTRLLLSYGVDPLVKSISGKLPLHVAVVNAPDVVDLLLQDGQDVNMTESVNHDTPLHVACGMCCQDSILKLIQYGALMNLENKQGDTPLAKLLKHTNKPNDFHAKTRIKLAKLLISIGFRMKEKPLVAMRGSRHKGRDKTFDKYKEVKVLCNYIPSLQNLSRMIIRECLTCGVGVPKQVLGFDIPTNLKHFLLCRGVSLNHDCER